MNTIIVIFLISLFQLEINYIFTKLYKYFIAYAPQNTAASSLINSYFINRIIKFILVIKDLLINKFNIFTLIKYYILFRLFLIIILSITLISISQNLAIIKNQILANIIILIINNIIEYYFLFIKDIFLNNLKSFLIITKLLIIKQIQNLYILVLLIYYL